VGILLLDREDVMVLAELEVTGTGTDDDICEGCGRPAGFVWIEEKRARYCDCVVRYPDVDCEPANPLRRMG